MRSGMVKTVTLVGCRVQLPYFPTGLPQQLFVLENEEWRSPASKVSLLKKMEFIPAGTSTVV